MKNPFIRTKSGMIIPWKCPKCKNMTSTYPALSRRDNKTYICDPCGTKEALEDFYNYNKKQVK
jgi:predicted RNA-binding Zn-ribbon protein involved in translation (DUF1610 family)